jgi:hypothetical protein
MINLLFSLLIIKGLHMFPALLAHPQEAPQAALGIVRARFQLTAPGLKFHLS